MQMSKLTYLISYPSPTKSRNVDKRLPGFRQYSCHPLEKDKIPVRNSQAFHVFDRIVTNYTIVIASGVLSI